MSKKRTLGIAGAVAVLAGWAGIVSFGAFQAEPATLVLTNGKFITLDEDVPAAAALAARGDKIVAVGSGRGDRPVHRAGDRGRGPPGRLATPGWIDSHLHFTGVGEAKLSLDLTKAKNWDEIVAMVAEAVKNAAPGDASSPAAAGIRKNGTGSPNPTSTGCPFTTP